MVLLGLVLSRTPKGFSNTHRLTNGQVWWIRIISMVPYSTNWMIGSSTTTLRTQILSTRRRMPSLTWTWHMMQIFPGSHGRPSFPLSTQHLSRKMAFSKDGQLHRPPLKRAEGRRNRRVTRPGATHKGIRFSTAHLAASGADPGSSRRKTSIGTSRASTFEPYPFAVRFGAVDGTRGDGRARTTEIDT